MSREEGQRRLTTLAHILDARGWRAQIINPSGLPLLEVIDPHGAALMPEQVICERRRDDDEWYRWRQNGTYIAPADQPDAAATEVMRALAPKGKP